MMNNDKKIICQNKKAHHEYFIEETYECGIVLQGTEIKSIRLGKTQEYQNKKFLTTDSIAQFVEYVRDKTNINIEIKTRMVRTPKIILFIFRVFSNCS